MVWCGVVPPKSSQTDEEHLGWPTGQRDGETRGLASISSRPSNLLIPTLPKDCIAASPPAPLCAAHDDEEEAEVPSRSQRRLHPGHCSIHNPSPPPGRPPSRYRLLFPLADLILPFNSAGSARCSSQSGAAPANSTPNRCNSTLDLVNCCPIA